MVKRRDASHQKSLSSWWRSPSERNKRRSQIMKRKRERRFYFEIVETDLVVRRLPRRWTRRAPIERRLRPMKTIASSIVVAAADGPPWPKSRRRQPSMRCGMASIRATGSFCWRLRRRYLTTPDPLGAYQLCSGRRRQCRWLSLRRQKSDDAASYATNGRWLSYLIYIYTM